MSIAGLLSGLVSGFGERSLFEQDRRRQEKLAERKFLADVLVRELDNPNLRPEGRQIIMGQLGKVLGAKRGQLPDFTTFADELGGIFSERTPEQRIDLPSFPIGGQTLSMPHTFDEGTARRGFSVPQVRTAPGTETIPSRLKYMYEPGELEEGATRRKFELEREFEGQRLDEQLGRIGKLVRDPERRAEYEAAIVAGKYVPPDYSGRVRFGTASLSGADIAARFPVDLYGNPVDPKKTYRIQYRGNTEEGIVPVQTTAVPRVTSGEARMSSLAEAIETMQDPNAPPARKRAAELYFRSEESLVKQREQMLQAREIVMEYNRRRNAPGSRPGARQAPDRETAQMALRALAHIRALAEDRRNQNPSELYGADLEQLMQTVAAELGADLNAIRQSALGFSRPGASSPAGTQSPGRPRTAEELKRELGLP
jgi:hypothetical protein